MPTPSTLVRTPAEIGSIVRAARVDQDLDQATAAGLAGVGVRFMGELERGKPTLRLGLAMRVVQLLGFDVWIVPRGQRPAE